MPKWIVPSLFILLSLPPMTYAASRGRYDIHRTETADEFKRAAKYPDPKQFSDILESYPETSPGLIVIDALQHEIRAAANFAAELKQRYGLTLILWSRTTYGFFVPGFDGVVVDGENNVVANFIIKNMSAGSPDESVLDRAVQTSFERMDRFQNVDEWTRYFETNAIPPSMLGSAKIIHLNAEKFALAQAKKETIRELISFYLSDSKKRMRWLLLDVGERPFDRHDVQIVQSNLEDNRERFLLIKSQDKILTLNSDQVNEFSCERALASP